MSGCRGPVCTLSRVKASPVRGRRQSPVLSPPQSILLASSSPSTWTEPPPRGANILTRVSEGALACRVWPVGSKPSHSLAGPPRIRCLARSQDSSIDDHKRAGALFWCQGCGRCVLVLYGRPAASMSCPLSVVYACPSCGSLQGGLAVVFFFWAGHLVSRRGLCPGV